MTNEEKKQAQQKAMEQAEKQILDDVEKYTDDPKEVLELVRYFNKMGSRYSFKNMMYLRHQGAYVVNSYKQWQALGYQVQKGEKALKLWMPWTINLFKDGGKWIPVRYATKEQKAKINRGELETFARTEFSLKACVFDANQTDIDPKDLPSLYPNKHIDFDGMTNAEIDSKVDKLVDVLHYIGVSVDLNPANFNESVAKGYFVPATNSLLMNPRNTKTESFAVLVHETAHAILHSKEDNAVTKELKINAGSELKYEFKELQAELTAYMVADALGLDTKESSKKYLASWTDNGEKFNRLDAKDKATILESVTKLAGYLVDKLEDKEEKEQVA